jgi:hypothetical protein
MDPNPENEKQNLHIQILFPILILPQNVHDGKGKNPNEEPKDQIITNPGGSEILVVQIQC